MCISHIINSLNTDSGEGPIVLSPPLKYSYVCSNRYCCTVFGRSAKRAHQPKDPTRRRMFGQYRANSSGVPR
jgi:hypothetical protein